jgi:hypothetical protein
MRFSMCQKTSYLYDVWFCKNIFVYIDLKEIENQGTWFDIMAKTKNIFTLKKYALSKIILPFKLC